MNTSRQDQEYLKNLTVLYVEDDQDAREQVAEFIRRLVGTLVVASDGNEGLDAFRTHRPRIVVSDIQMPGMEGLAMLQEIRKIDASVQMVVITAFEEMDYLIRAAILDIKRYVTKPASGEQLEEALLECAWCLRLAEKVAG